MSSPIHNTQSEKSKSRKEAFKRRKSAFEAVSYDLASDVLELTNGAKIVAAYMAMRTEIDPTFAMKALTEAGKRVCVPVILGKGRALEFREWIPDAQMIEGEFGALIPQGTSALIPDFVLAPLVAYDAYATRLGYGGGFYDRTLEQLRSEGDVPYWGLAFSAQKSDVPLPREKTDIPLDGVITEIGATEFSV